ncbi:hypothetical protein Chor_014570, partial [Crotalus horridus]
MSPKRRKLGPVTSSPDSLEEGRKLDSADTEALSGTKKFKSQEDPRTQSLAETAKETRLSAGLSVAEFPYNKKRVRLISPAPELKEGAQGILYWMSREQRVQDNWAFLYAQRLALKQRLPLHVCFCLVPKFLDATIRHFGFLLKGLEEVAEECRMLDIPFHLLTGFAKDRVPHFVTQHGIGGVVTDFSPLRVPLQWVRDVQEQLPSDVPLAQVPGWGWNRHGVDAHNIVPCWVASDKQEYGARTIRRKIQDRLAEFLTEFPPLPINWEACYASLQVDRSVKEVEWARPGSASGYKESVEGFIEEAVVRRELADNFCFYNPNYDKIEGAYDWAKTTLKLHAKDKRPYLYTLEQLEEGKTHDLLWNAAQVTGRPEET